MDKKILKGLVDEKLDVIQEQFAIIKSYEGKIPAIELDLVMANIRDLYELVLSLQVENISTALHNAEHVAEPAMRPQAAEEPEPVTPPPAAEPIPTVRISSGILSIEPITENEPEPEPEPPAYTEPEPELEQPVNAVPEPEPERIPEVSYIPDPQPEKSPNRAPEPEAETQAEKTQRITFDLFTENTGNILADRLREGQEKRIADKLTENKVVDLRNTIGINDKFLFINELFDGNMRIYEDVIQKLNSAVTMAQADLLMLDLKIAYNWDSESPSVKKFVELVRRKF